MTAEDEKERLLSLCDATARSASHGASKLRATGNADAADLLDAIALACAPSPRAMLEERRRVLVDRTRNATHDAPLAERVGMLAIGREALLLTSFRSSSAPENIETAIALVDETITLIDAAVVRGDMEAWIRYRAGAVTLDELRLRLLVSGRASMAPEPTPESTTDGTT